MPNHQETTGLRAYACLWISPENFQKIPLTLRTLYGRVRYPLCAGCRCRPMQPMGSRQLTPKGMQCNGTGGLYGGDVGILYGPGIASDAFRLLYMKSGGLVTSIGL